MNLKILRDSALKGLSYLKRLWTILKINIGLTSKKQLTTTEESGSYVNKRLDQLIVERQKIIYSGYYDMIDLLDKYGSQELRESPRLNKTLFILGLESLENPDLSLEEKFNLVKSLATLPFPNENEVDIDDSSI
jgi:hypothetical protein